MSVPDVSVVVAVFNTMPYLSDTLASLERQTLGMERMQVLLIDDGSTDGSPEEIARFAQRYPEVVTTYRQDNSGTPASPFNRGLERATGRYVFFLGADDYLADEALEALVGAADEWDSDVVSGKTVGINGRSVNQRLFNLGTTRDLDPFDSPLPYNLANSRLFRRELIERLGLRYREDVRSHCDHPFTFTAIMHARRVSVLADRPLYFAVKQEGLGNVTFTTHPHQVLRSAETIMSTMAAELEAGERRDYYIRRQFEWEISALLNPSLLDLDEDVRNEVLSGVHVLSGTYLTDALLGRINVRERLRLALAREGDFETLLAVVESIRTFKDANGKVPFFVDGGRTFACYPGFGAASTRREWYEVHGEHLTGRLVRGLVTRSVRRDGSDLVVECSLAVSGLAGDDVRAGLLPVGDSGKVVGAGVGDRTFEPAAVDLATVVDDVRTDLTIRVSGQALRDSPAASLRLSVRIGPRIYDLPLSGAIGSATVRVRRFPRRKAVKVESNNNGMLVVTPVRGASSGSPRN